MWWGSNGSLSFRIFAVLLVNLVYLIPEGKGVYPGWMSTCFLVGEESTRPREIKKTSLARLGREGESQICHFLLLMKLCYSPKGREYEAGEGFLDQVLIMEFLLLIRVGEHVQAEIFVLFFSPKLPPAYPHVFW